MSKMTENSHRVVGLNNVVQNNIVLLDLTKPQEESLFRPEYANAVKAIERILEQNRGNRHSLGFGASCPYADITRRTGSDWDNYTEYHTAIPFIGDRGTGKTSVMCTIHRWLSSEEKNNAKNAEVMLSEKFSDVHFIAFDFIDASVLKQTEDVLEVILARMLDYLSEIPGNHDFSSLYRKIDELDKSLKRVYWNNGSGQTDAGLLALQRTVDVQKSARIFRQLVQDFTAKVSEICFRGEPCYLVIAVDDVDLYQGNASVGGDGQFILLDQIYSYLRGPKMIVLMTYNEHILKRVCNRHFQKIYYGNNIPCDPTPTERQEVERLTSQYLSRLFPQNQRIYLPNFKALDSGNHSSLRIRIQEDNAIISEISSKDYILQQIAKKTGVYFDAAGTKKHFLEPRNLREWGELIQIVNAMEDIPTSAAEEKDAASIQAANRQYLLSYFYNQFTQMNLGTEDAGLLLNWAALPLHRQQRDIVDLIRRHRVEITKNESESFGYLPGSDHDRWKYSYGELLHNLYFATRIPKKYSTDEKFFSKELVHGILGTHSVIMTEIMNQPDNQGATSELIGSSIAGRWANEMLPKLATLESEASTAYKYVPVGSLSLPIQDFFDWEIPADVQEAVEKLNLCKINDSQQLEGEDWGDDKLNALKNFMKSLFFIRLFFTSLPSDGLQISLMPQYDPDADKVMAMLFSKSSEKVCFNVLNPVLFGEHNQGGQTGYLDDFIKKLEKLGVAFSTVLSIDKKDFLPLVDQLCERWKELDSTINNDEADGYEFKMRVATVQISIQEQIQSVIKDWFTKRKPDRASRDTMSEAEQLFCKKWNIVLNKVREELTALMNNNASMTQGDAYLFPIHNFDMMYNIIKRLASDSYYDMPEDTAIDQLFSHVCKLYDNAVHELQMQDNAYCEIGKVRFADTLRNSGFYQLLKNGADGSNRYIAEVYQNMMLHAVQSRIVYKRITSFGDRSYGSMD